MQLFSLPTKFQIILHKIKLVTRAASPFPTSLGLVAGVNTMEEAHKEVEEMLKEKKESETDEEFKKRIALLTDAEIKAEFMDEHNKLMRKYNCCFGVSPIEIFVARVNFSDIPK